jgi:hypothetical protein
VGTTLLIVAFALNGGAILFATAIYVASRHADRRGTGAGHQIAHRE